MCSMKEIENFLENNSDQKYAEFQRKIINNIPEVKIYGVRTPLLRKFAKDFSKNDFRDQFLNDLPHKSFDENQLHSFVICEEKDFKKCIELVEKFLPFIDNWATCDQLSPKVFAKHLPEIREKILQWIKSSQTYTIRFGIGMAMTYFLDKNFDAEIMEEISKIRNEEYYVKMMVAWYFATALTKNWENAIKIIETKKLNSWTHNKAIQKARESRRITSKQKEYLKSLKTK